ncbi:hypothetical protein [Xanthomonas graminis]|uniref:hypothetical protein n=1 Tax=Xanthomonas graminis TaxID=3390026 RepID=UPI001F3A3587|nr:hypothetical protein [Xanthomonas translucens]UKE73740.1 hypothetical protein KFS85_01920 [Xanthomonas translucens pv. phleipratensis]
MLQSLSTLLFDGLLLALPIIGIVRLRGVRLNWATLAAIFVAMMSAHCIQVAAGLTEQALPILCATLIGAFTLCAMVVSACHATRRAGRENTP